MNENTKKAMLAALADIARHVCSWRFKIAVVLERLRVSNVGESSLLSSVTWEIHTEIPYLL